MDNKDLADSFYTFVSGVQSQLAFLTMTTNVPKNVLLTMLKLTACLLLFL